jgi:hypothetical protein
MPPGVSGDRRFHKAEFMLSFGVRSAQAQAEKILSYRIVGPDLSGAGRCAFRDRRRGPPSESASCGSRAGRGRFSSFRIARGDSGGDLEVGRCLF